MSIERAHHNLKSVIGPDRIEPLEAAVAVEHIRQDWRPKKVRIVLLAESHVWTCESELESRVSVEGQLSTYVRFVYCLGYGENSLVSPSVLNNGGTWQYWRLFNDCIDGPVDSYRRLLRSGEPKDGRRIQAKIDLLKKMKNEGVWLVDASVTALYRPVVGRLVSGRKYDNALRVSWDDHVKAVMGKCRPKKVLIVGKGVWGALSDRIKMALPYAQVCRINQPNARLSLLERNAERKQCHDFCCGITTTGRDI